MNYKILVAASLASMVLTSSAFAQCAPCALYPDRDPLNNGALTPAGKMGLERPGGAARVFDTNGSSNAMAGVRGDVLQQSATSKKARHSSKAKQD